MNYGAIKNCDIANGPGVRVTLFVSGCRNHCENCFQQQTWDFNYGEPFDKTAENLILEMLSPDYIRGLTILGGEPLEPENQQAILDFIKRVREVYPKKDVWLFSGFTFEEINDPTSRAHTPVIGELLSQIDVLVDGRFVQALKNLSLKFRGSSNQRLIDMKQTLVCGEIILWDE